MSDVALSSAADRVLVYLYEVNQMGVERAASGNDVFAALPDLSEVVISGAIDELIGHGFIGQLPERDDMVTA